LRARRELIAPLIHSGLIVKAQSGFFTVRTEAGDFICHVRGRLKQQRGASDLVALGDRVAMSVQSSGQGMIEAIEPRRNALARKAPTGYGRRGARAGEVEREQVIIANPDQAVFVFACAQPEPHLGALDRFLVMAESAQLPAVICANKIDLGSRAAAEAIFGIYPPLGYRVIYTSARQSLGIDELRTQLRGRLSVLAGPSGVGKSSLLNAVQPGLGLRAREISQATRKGRHTTVFSELLPLEAGGYVADTPGMRALALWDVEPEELDGYFVEIKPLVPLCEFSDCTHRAEPGCAVRAAVEAGRIARSRYDSYCRMRAEKG
jgi:ribosome biogenesis GTPase